MPDSRFAVCSFLLARTILETCAHTRTLCLLHIQTEAWYMCLQIYKGESVFLIRHLDAHATSSPKTLLHTALTQNNPHTSHRSLIQALAQTIVLRSTLRVAKACSEGRPATCLETYINIPTTLRTKCWSLSYSTDICFIDIT